MKIRNAGQVGQYHRLGWYRPRRGRLVLFACGLSFLFGCSSVKLLNATTSAKQLEPEDFAPEVTTERSQPQETEPIVAVTTSTPQEPILSIREGVPELPTGPITAIEDPVLIESKVGDVNGKPIFATEFLEPMADRLAAEAKRRPRQEWVVWATTQIERGLQEIVTDELLRAEALSMLSPEQRQGLRAFLQGVRKELASGASGSRTLAAKRLAQKQGMTEEEYIAAEEQKALIQTTLMRDIDNRVNVSWRDIEQRYQRDFEAYNPPPTAVFRLIRIPAANEEAINKVQDSLAAGEDFVAVLETSGSNFKPDEGGVEEVQFKGAFEDAEFFGGKLLNEKAHSLTVGQWTGPFDIGSFKGWLYLEDIRQESISLYDAQLVIYNQILTERRSKELKRFMGRLEKRASFTELQQMRDRIFAIADERYGVRAAPRIAP